MSGTYNTEGHAKGEVASSGAPASQANPPADDKNMLESFQDATKKTIDDWVARQGDNKLAMGVGALAWAAADVFIPTAYWEVIPVGKAGKLLKKAGELTGVLKKGEHAVEDMKKLEAAAQKEKKAAETAKPRPSAKSVIRMPCIIKTWWREERIKLAMAAAYSAMPISGKGR